MRPEDAKRAMRLAPGSQVVVEMPGGERVRLSGIDTDGTGARSRAAVSVDEQLRVTASLVLAMAERVEALLVRVESALDRVNAAADGQAEVAAAARELAETMRMDVVPVYDSAGKLAGARRQAAKRGEDDK